LRPKQPSQTCERVCRRKKAMTDVLLFSVKRAYIVARFALLCFLIFCPLGLSAQQTGRIEGQILDPSSALIPGAEISLTGQGRTFTTTSGEDGRYVLKSIPVGLYLVSIEAKGFAQYLKPEVRIEAGRTQIINASLVIEVEQQQVQVSGQANGLSVNPDENSNAIVLNGASLDALSDNPDEMQSELQALAGPAAGPNGGQIYIDGFTGGQLPPKSSIREIRINQNPFSAEFDRLGYGRIEIFTKPGTDKFNGAVMGFGNTSALDTRNPLLVERPSYYNYDIRGHVDGPLFNHSSSYFVTAGGRRLNSQSVISAINPEDTSARLNVTTPNPQTTLFFSPRFDFMVGKSDTVTLRYSMNRFSQSGAGVGQLNLPEQAYSQTNWDDTLQVSDSHIVSAHLLTETRFQWRHINNGLSSDETTPTITVQGSFVSGGNSLGTVYDHQNIYELANTSTLAAGQHTMRFGVRLRSYDDANESTSGANGAYTFSSLAGYAAKTPDQYSVTVVRNPTTHVALFDGALFFQDDWRWKPNLTLSSGLRFEGQNRISNHADWAPRLALAWGLGHPSNGHSKTVLRAGYGWFYNRFNVPDSFTSASGTPYIVQAIQQNLVNQETYTVSDPAFFNPGISGPPPGIGGVGTPTMYSVSPHFHAALDMEAGIGFDRQLTKNVTTNATYLYTRGIHQYLTNNVSAPLFDPSSYELMGPSSNILNYQFQSGGVYSEHQVIATVNMKLKRVSLFGTYTYTDAHSDTQGVGFFPSIADNPGLDYGRPNFDIRNRLNLIGTLSLPGKVSIAPLFVYYSGTPYNITLGKDLTGNNQFNARPTYGVCGAANVVTTRYGCLDTDPRGKGERIIPYGLGTGPSNVILNLRVSKVIGIGPRTGGSGSVGNSSQNGGAGSSRGLTGNAGPGAFDAKSPRKYKLTLVGEADNALNTINWAPPNGVLSSPLFGSSQSLAGGPFATHTPGNRSIYVQAMFSF